MSATVDSADNGGVSPLVGRSVSCFSGFESADVVVALTLSSLWDSVVAPIGGVELASMGGIGEVEIRWPKSSQKAPLFAATAEAAPMEEEVGAAGARSVEDDAF